MSSFGDGHQPGAGDAAAASPHERAPGAEPTKPSERDERVRARRARRLEAYDALAAERERLAARGSFYHGEIRRIVTGLVSTAESVLEVGCGLGDVLAALPAARKVGLDTSTQMIARARARHPELDLRHVDVEVDELPNETFEVVLLSDAIGCLEDVEETLRRLRGLVAPGGRLVITYYNILWEPALRVAEALGVKSSWPDQAWLSMNDIRNLVHLAGYEVVRSGTDVLAPVHVPLVSRALNLVGAKLPALKELSLVQYFVVRPVPEKEGPFHTPVSVICPCRNERGNIRDAIERTPVMGDHTELIFVDGNSTDGTVEEIERAIRDYRGPLELRLVHQGDGKGKGDAVRKGFDAAKYPVLMILDSDLTVAPEDLPKFYRALVTNKGEFINGVRLTYPMEDEAMRFLNLLGNKFFSAALSWVLEQPIKDSLCGTKVLMRSDYDRIVANRHFFGDFDPFGDFDLLFGAARLNMHIVDMPVRYYARTYGDTKISRFTHGWLLAKMTAFGFRKLRT